ncbi:lipid A 3-O-deacylase [Oleiagrimonas sp. C23AA]|uniref:lipid A 3-O-deacylase n=1 Tax=Oleiagrimonas sp. C23AA TaxID=2719047 RepID=UPI00142456F2|nr:lipid A 3-O-deacylase [Oleiagrimonas sp. C23AA]NII11317.1 lipid A 3-O-deacylase [Oleiagrimonas sp. C23AA]
MRYPLLTRGVAALVLGMAVAGSAQAAHIDLSAGRSMTSDTRWADAVFIDGVGNTRDWRGIDWQPVATAGWIKARNTHEDNLDHDVYIGAAGVRLVNWWRRAFFSFQLGVADGRTDALSSAGEFVSTLGWQGDHYQLMLRHISNGHVFHGRNLGETMALVGVRF